MIPVYEPLLNGREMEYVADCIRSGWISSAGSYIETFEQKWAEYCGRRFGIAVSSGTTALQLSVACLGLQPGDEILMPAFTIISCPLAAVYNQVKPVLVDADPDTWCMNTDRIEERITERTQCIMPVHIYGHPVDMEPLMALARKYGLKVIEDAAEAHGAQCFAKATEIEEKKWARCGGFGDMSVFSFYANKPVTTGEGGMVVTDDPRLEASLRFKRNLCFGKERRFDHQDLGFNFRMTNVQAAMGLAQMEQLEKILEKKRWIAGEYSRQLEEVKGIKLPVQKDFARNIYWMFAVEIREETEKTAEDLARKLAESGIGTRSFFQPIHEQPVLKKIGLFHNENYPVAERIARQGLYLPSGLTLQQEQIEQVCDAVKHILA